MPGQARHDSGKSKRERKQISATRAYGLLKKFSYFKIPAINHPFLQTHCGTAADFASYGV